jgi:hypothetical protein
VQRLYPKVSGTYPAAWVLTAQDILRLLSPSYLATLGRQKVDEWVSDGVLTPEGPDRHVLPLIMLLPFVLNERNRYEHRRLEELLTVIIQELGSCDPHAAYTVFYTPCCAFRRSCDPRKYKMACRSIQTGGPAPWRKASAAPRSSTCMETRTM